MSDVDSVPVMPIPESFRRYLRQHLTQDHEKLEGMLADAAYLIAHSSFYTAAKRFGEFRIVQEQHMAMEEDIIFALLGTATPNSPQIAEVKMEHSVIKQAMGASADAILAGSKEEFEKTHGDLVAALNIHTKHEEELLASALEIYVHPNGELLRKIARL